MIRRLVNNIRTALTLGIVLCLIACQGTQSLEAGAGYRHATFLSHSEGKGYRQVEVRHPWEPNATPLATYILVPHDAPLPEHLPKGTLLRTPLKRTAVFSAVHLGLLQRLGQMERVVGIADKAYIMLPEVKAHLATQEVQDLGVSHNPNLEMIVKLRPDAILQSPIAGQVSAVGDLGIPQVWCADYMEPTALARAEWMRFYGLLYGVEAQADSLFAAIEAEYDSLKRLASTVKLQPKAILDLPMSGTWYTPGGRSYVANLLADAGICYAYAEDSTSGSITTNAEQTLLHSDATLWLMRYYQSKPYTLEQVRQEVPIAPHIMAFQQGSVYGCNTAYSPYYDETPFAPHWLLRDLIKIVHPKALPHHSLRYFERME